jgi:hypothetical protein
VALHPPLCTDRGRLRPGRLGWRPADRPARLDSSRRRRRPIGSAISTVMASAGARRRVPTHRPDERVALSTGHRSTRATVRKRRGCRAAAASGIAGYPGDPEQIDGGCRSVRSPRTGLRRAGRLHRGAMASASITSPAPNAEYVRSRCYLQQAPSPTQGARICRRAGIWDGRHASTLWVLWDTTPCA